jgi:hypothetical protein
MIQTWEALAAIAVSLPALLLGLLFCFTIAAKSAASISELQKIETEIIRKRTQIQCPKEV